MTKNQIEYGKLVESKRANLAQESLTRERDKASRRLGVRQQVEVERANRVREQQATMSLDETRRSNLARELEAQRHNRQVESLNIAQLEEVTRSNRVREMRDQLALEETRRANVARETETQRYNRVREVIDTGYLNEAVRHNKATEVVEQGRLDVSKYQADTQRQSMLNQARYQQQSISLGYSQLGETRRANMARESMQQMGINEQIRSNIANEDIRRSQATTQRISAVQSAVNESRRVSESKRSNLAREVETRRANRATERISSTRNDLTKRSQDIQLLDVVSKFGTNVARLSRGNISDIISLY